MQRIVVVVGFLLFASEAHAADGPTLDKSKVPANGRGAAHVTLPGFGRYGITVRSRQGVALQVVDRVAGPGPVLGQPGAVDGRLDAFFDRGTYRILTFGDPASEGHAAVAVHGYRELNAPAPAQLVELRPIDTTVGDFEQRSYWLDVPKRRTVVLEAAGRNLGDLRLWRDGTWIEDATPTRDTTEPTVGRPLTVLRIAATLEPGLYLVTAYGGPENKWAEDDGSHPLHLRFGIPTLPEALRRRYTVGPFGYDRFIVPKADYFRIELDASRPLSADIRSLNAERPFNSSYVAQLAITKKTIPPVAETTAAAGGAALVTVRGARGLPYVLQHFRATRRIELRNGRSYVSTIHAGTPGDQLDATGIITTNIRPHRAKHWQAVRLSSDDGFKRRFNLLGTATVFLDVLESGDYTIESAGAAKAMFKVEPFFITAPDKYKSPSPKRSGESWALDRGLFVLTIVPAKLGIIDLTMARAGFFQKIFGSAPSRAPPMPAVRFESLATTSKQWLVTSAQPGVQIGVIQRSLPIDLLDPLAVAQRPKETLKFDVEVREPGLLYAEADDGRRLEIAVDGGAWNAAHHPAVGRHQVQVRHAGADVVVYSLGLRPRRLDPDVPLPALPSTRLAALPEYDVLSGEKPVYLDLERTEKRSYLVNATAPGLYRLESTGLLATSGNLRTRTVTSLTKQTANGVGRNFLIQQYLGVGDYQVTVAPKGKSQGHLGVRLKRTPEQNGGELVDHIPARTTLRAGDTIAYRFEIKRAGRYRLRAFGQGRTLRARVEDHEGWPIEVPGIEADLYRDFEPGRYRLIVLPETVDVRVVTVLEADPIPVVRQGHGPHPLRIDEVADFVWLDTTKADDVRDMWTFEIPADIDVKIELTGKMHGDLVRRETKGATKVAYVPPLRGWNGSLSKGRYELSVQNLHQTTKVPYTVAVRSVQLVVGRTWNVRAPNVVPIAIGETDLAEISSFGGTDVEARLFDANGVLVARSDDRPDDWNFFLAPRLVAGRYTLQVDPVGSRRAETRVTIKTREEDIAAPLAVPAKQTIVIGDRRRVFPLTLPTGKRLLAVSAESPETIGLVVSRKDKAWMPVATHVGRPARIVVPLDDDGKSYRLEVWSSDERGSPIALSVQTPTPERIDEQKLARGVDVGRARGLKFGIAEVELNAPGTFRLFDESAITWTADRGTPATVSRRGLVHADGKTLWIVRSLDTKKRGRVRAERVRLSGGVLPLSIGVDPIQVDLAIDTMIVATVSAPTAPAGVAVVKDGEAITPARYDVRDGGAVTSVHVDGRGARARLWSASEVAGRFDATLTVRGFDRPKPAAVGLGEAQGTIAPGQAAELALTPGLKRFDVAMSAGGVAAVASAQRVERVSVSGAELERFEAVGDRMLLFNPTSTPLTYAVTALPIISRVATMKKPLELDAKVRGRTEIFIAPARTPRTLELRGATSAVYLDASGRIETGTSIPISPDGGLVRVRHDAGPLVAWLDEPGHPGLGLFDKRPAVEHTVRAPSLRSLVGAPQIFRFNAKTPTLFVVRIDTPVVTRWQTSAFTETNTRGASTTGLPLYLTKGEGELWVRAVGSGAMDGKIAVTEMPVVALGEGTGPEVMIAPGHPRAFVFDVDRRGDIGVGVRADSASVTAVLRRAGGGEVGRGVVQMHTLEPGAYLLVLSSPPDGVASVARPAVVGLDPPPTGPPTDVLQSYGGQR